jgi:hypothetical protein
MTFSIHVIKEMVHVVEGNIENLHPSKNQSTSAYASVDNGFIPTIT